MGPESGLSNSVGWQRWNMSKRVSSANIIATIARKHFESCQQTRYWSANDLAELQRLTHAMEDCAVRANATWRELQTTSSRNSGDVETTEVHSGNQENSELLSRTQDVYRAGNVTEYWDYVDDFKRLLVSAEWEGNRHRWNVIGRAQRQRERTNIIAPDESRPRGDATTTSNSYSISRAKRYALLPEEGIELRRLTSRLDDCATQARATFDSVNDFLNEVDPARPMAGLWPVSRRVQQQMFSIRSTDSVLEDSVEIERSIFGLLNTAAARKNATG